MEDFELEEVAREAEMSTLLTTQEIIDAISYVNQGDDDGSTVSQDAVLAALRGVIAEEDPGKPLSDERISERLKEEGFPVARRTVAKYRDKLGIPGAFERGMARSAR